MFSARRHAHQKSAVVRFKSGEREKVTSPLLLRRSCFESESRDCVLHGGCDREFEFALHFFFVCLFSPNYGSIYLEVTQLVVHEVIVRVPWN